MTHPDFRALCAELAERLDRRARKSRKEIELIDSTRAALAAEPPADVRYEFTVYDAETDMPQASGEAPTLEEAQREGQHYFAMHSEDGPMRLELRRVEMLLLSEPQP